MLKKSPPTPQNPVRVYMSTTDNLQQISYTAEIIGWEHKELLTTARRKSVRNHLKRYQPGEINLFDGLHAIGKKAVNLVKIRNLVLLQSLHPINLLVKCSDNLPLKNRTRSGGWSEVNDIGDILNLPSLPGNRVAEELNEKIAQAKILSDSALQKILSASPKLPERIQVVSTGFRRNPHVIVAVLRRAGGKCEDCGKAAPFNRRSDGSPFLEVHHKKPLSEDGEDTVANALALCPNCHRKAHHG